MIGISQKLMLGFAGLLAVVVAIGVLTMDQIDELGKAIDVILKENYRSVVACQEMKASLERVDSGILLALIGDEAKGAQLIEENILKFNAALDVELNNITLVGERERSERIRALFETCTAVVPYVIQPSRGVEARRAEYVSKLQPLFQEINKNSKKFCS